MLQSMGSERVECELIYRYRCRCIYPVEYYSAIKRNGFESVLVRWMNLESVIQS